MLILALTENGTIPSLKLRQRVVLLAKKVFLKCRLKPQKTRKSRLRIKFLKKFPVKNTNQTILNRNKQTDWLKSKRTADKAQVTRKQKTSRQAKVKTPSRQAKVKNTNQTSQSKKHQADKPKLQISSRQA